MHHFYHRLLGRCCRNGRSIPQLLRRKRVRFHDPHDSALHFADSSSTGSHASLHVLERNPPWTDFLLPCGVEFGIGDRGCFFDQGQSVNDFNGKLLRTDAEIFVGALGLGSPVLICGDLDLPHRIRLNSSLDHKPRS